MLRAAALLTAVLLPACAGMSDEDNRRFQAETAGYVAAGSPFVEAIQKLAKADFDCDERVAAPAIDCSRTRAGLLYSCVQRLDLTVDAPRRTVLAVAPRPIACAGL